MTDLLTRRLALFASPENRALLGRGLRGVERETLRVTPDGQLATTPHPAVLGSALTNEQITTDYSESLLEFITRPNTTSPRRSNASMKSTASCMPI